MHKKLILIALLFFMSVCPVAASEPMAAQDKKDIERLMDRIVQKYIGNDPHATEYKDAQTFVLKRFTNPTTNDVFVFFTIEGYGGGNNYSFYLAIFTQRDKKYQLVDTKNIGGKVRQIDFGYVDIRGHEFFLQSGEFDDIRNQEAYGVEKVYYRWRLSKGKLHADQKIYIRKNGSYVQLQQK